MIRQKPRGDFAGAARGTVLAAYVFGALSACGLLVDVSRVARAESEDASLLATSPAGSASATPVSADARDHAREATERSTRFRDSGDPVHATIGDGVAHEWAEAARDIELAVDAEKMAAERRREAMRAQAQLQRTRTLVEECIARLGRLQAELGAADPAMKAKPAMTTDGGKP
jgi:hypothetical protein